MANDILVRVLGKDDLSGTLDKAEGSAGKFGSSMKKVGAVAGVALGGLALTAGPALKGLGDELKIMGDKAATVFGDQLKPMQDWAAANNRAFGLSKQATLDLATSMSDLLIPMGFTREAAAEQSRTMVGAAGALSAWSKGKFTAAEVSDIMTKAILGETDGLKALGISISADEVAARLLAKGQKELTGEALAQAKAIATQELIMEKSTDAQKAWSDGTMDAVKAQNAAKAKSEEAKATLAQSLQPAFAGLTNLLIGTVIPAVEKVTGFFSEHRGAAIALGVVIGTLAAGLIAFKVAALASAAATQLSAVATGVWTAAQWLLNTALAANPIGLIVIAIAALVAGIVLAYNHFDWFRSIVDTVWGALKTGFGWIQDNWPLLLAILTGPIGLAVLAIAKNWDSIREGFDAVKRFIGEKIDVIVGFVTGMPDRIAGAARGMWDGIKDAFRSALNWIIDKWNGLEFTIPSISVFGASIGGTTIGVPDIDRFDKGGRVPGALGAPLLAVVHGGEEIRTPAQQRSGGGSGSGGGGGTTVILELNGREVARALINEGDRSGGLPLRIRAAT